MFVSEYVKFMKDQQLEECLVVWEEETKIREHHL